jgi:dienelactone hydrolase
MNWRGLAAGVAAALCASTIDAAEPVAPPPLEAYGALPAVEQIALSADGQQVAYVGLLGEERRLFAFTAAGKPVWSGRVGDLKVRDLQWANNSILLMKTSQTVNLGPWLGEKHELHTENSIDISSQKVVTIFIKQPRLQPVIFGDYGIRKIADRWYGFFSTLTLKQTADEGLVVNGATLDLYRVDLSTGDIHLTAQGGERSSNWLVGEAGAVVARSDYDDATGDWSFTAGGRTLMKQQSRFHEIDLDGFGRSTASALVDDNTGASPRYLEIALNGGVQPVELYADFDVANLIRARNGVLLGALNRERTEARFEDPKLAARYLGARKAFPGYQFHLLDYTDDLGRMIARTDGGDDSGTYWLVDIATGSAKVLAEDYPSVKPKQVGATKQIAYKAADGLQLDGVLTLPPGSPGKNLPVIVMPHGGPIGVDDGLGFDWWAQAFASRGYAVLQPNYRGSSGRGLEFERKGYGEWGRKMLSDIADGLAALAKDGVVDPKRACIVGASYGGYAALAAVTVQQGLYRCAASVGGVSDVARMLDYDRDHLGSQTATVRFIRKALGEDTPGAPSLADISPARFAARADAPVLLVHGKDDSVVEFEQSRVMERALKGANKPVEFVELAGEDHWLSKSATRTAMLKAVVAFVQKHNPAE